MKKTLDNQNRVIYLGTRLRVFCISCELRWYTELVNTLLTQIGSIYLNVHNKVGEGKGYTMKTGIYHDLPMSEYHADPATGKSILYDFWAAPTPGHYHCRTLHPSQKKVTDEMLFGTAVHAAVLEPDKFKDFIVIPGPEVLAKNGARSGNAWKEWKAQQDEAGKHIVMPGDDVKIEDILHEVHENPANREAREMLTGGKSEVSFFWIDPETGYPCKCRPDHLPGDQIVTDLKVTGYGMASESEFRKVAANKKYHWSCYWTLKGVTECTGVIHDVYRFFVIERDPPYAIGIFTALRDVVALAETQIKPVFDELVECIKTDVWPMPITRREVTLPPWERKDFSIHKGIFNNEEDMIYG